MRILWLDAVEPGATASVGGKAQALARLRRRGLPVPDGFVVVADALDAQLESLGLAERARAGGDVAAAVRAAPLPSAWSADLQQAARTLGGPFAVRSSGVDEDGALASHAGQFHTALGVDVGAPLERALRACWASAWSGRVRAYRGDDRGYPRVAVVVQRALAPRAAGVLFTVNPANGSWREMTVEAAWGLGEAVVDGKVVPDFYRVRRPRRTPRPVQRVLARLRLEITERATGSQERQWLPGDGGVLEQPVPAARRGTPCLDDRSLLRLCRLGLRAEALLGGPQDLEWALDEAGELHVLQSRPVTTARDVRRSGPVLWTRRFVGERWTEPATPLGWSEMQHLLHHFIAYPQTSRRLLGGAEPSQLVRFAPYLNVTVFRHLAFKMPGAAPPRFMLELLPPAEEQQWLRRRAAAPDLAVYRSILAETARERRWQRFRWNPLSNWRAWAEFEASLDGRLAALEPVRDRPSARRRIEACRVLARDYIKVHICSLLFANIWFEAARAALSSAGRASLSSILLQPPADTATARTNAALWELGRGHRRLDAFLEAYGHRAASSWELFSPRWREQPDQVLRLARTTAAGADPRPDQRARQARVDAELRRLPRPLRSTVVMTRRYLQLREDQRFHFDRVLWRWKEALLWLEADVGLQLRYLQRGELESLLDGEVTDGLARELVAERSAAFAEEVARRAAGDEPPDFLVGDAAAGGVASGRRLTGQGISTGVLTGTARVLRSLDDAGRLRPGDILVTRATDPGWTPLFHVAGGLVMELGGMLSHGAVVAREYGLPAVVRVPDATRAIADGRTITVDGGRGVVWLR